MPRGEPRIAESGGADRRADGKRGGQPGSGEEDNNTAAQVAGGNPHAIL